MQHQAQCARRRRCESTGGGAGQQDQAAKALVRAGPGIGPLTLTSGSPLLAWRRPLAVIASSADRLHDVGMGPAGLVALAEALNKSQLKELQYATARRRPVHAREAASYLAWLARDGL